MDPEQLQKRAEPRLSDVPPSSDSPCQGVCRLDSLLVCEGCGRTIEEIADWPFVSEAERTAINQRAQSRLQARQDPVMTSAVPVVSGFSGS